MGHAVGGAARGGSTVRAGLGKSPGMPLAALPDPRAGVPGGRRAKLLVVDDVPLMRGGISRVLRRLGYRVLEASSALEVQRLTLRESDIRLLFLDLSPLEISDLEFVAWFRLRHPDIKVVVAATSIWDLSFYPGVTREITLLAKPFTPVELARIVRRALG